MPYDPYAATERERSGSYSAVWIGLVASLSMLAANVIPMTPIEGVAATIVGLHLVIFNLGNRFDEHFLALRDKGFVWAMTVIGIWLTAQGLLTVFEGAYGAGYTAAGAPTIEGDFSFRLPGWFNRAFLVVSAACVAFYSGFAAAYWRSGE